MDPSFLESFRCLDDRTLDLSLGNFHHQPSNRPLHTSSGISKPVPRKSFNYHRSRPSIPESRPSFSSIDPDARHYHDPEARLKLRIHLASLQKFDEALLFGFPSVDDKKQQPSETKPSAYITTVVNTEKEKEKENITPPKIRQRTMSSLSSIPETRRGRKSTTLSRSPDINPTPQWRTCVHPTIPAGQREMTLKMTLTRPDLRTTESSLTMPSTNSPLRLGEVSPSTASFLPLPWEEEIDEPNTMKRLWRKCRNLGQAVR